VSEMEKGFNMRATEYGWSMDGYTIRDLRLALTNLRIQIYNTLL
jgi:hypothetical protein